MSRFKELTSLALAKRQAFLELQEECNRFAVELVNALKIYLECPADTVFCHEVNRKHETTGRRTNTPMLCFCPDAFWYFYLEFEFSSAAEGMQRLMGAAWMTGILVGIKKSAQGLIVKFPEKEVMIKDRGQLTEFCEFFYNDLKAMLSRPWTEMQGSYGFGKVT